MLGHYLVGILVWRNFHGEYNSGGESSTSVLFVAT
jgi:hypothetical protein